MTLGLFMFLAVFLTIYGSANLYLFRRLKILAPAGVWARKGLALFLALMVFLPVISRTLDWVEWTEAARITAWAGFTWMGLAFILFLCFLVADLVRLAVSVLRLRMGQASLCHTRKVAVGALAAAVLFFAYGLYEASHPRVVELKLLLPGLTGPPVRLALVSDLHLSVMDQKTRLNRMVEMLEGMKPDLVVAAGDMIDGSKVGGAWVEERLRSIRAPLGKYAVLGNHEFYSGADRSAASLAKGGFRVLRCEVTVAGGRLNLAGVDDRSWGGEAEELRVLDQVRPGLPTIFVKHRPEVNESTLGRFQLMLSGHTHGGQIFPFGLVTRLTFPLNVGLYELDHGSRIYVSRGFGTWGPPVRVLSPPEAVLITLEPASPAGSREARPPLSRPTPSASY